MTKIKREILVCNLFILLLTSSILCKGQEIDGELELKKIDRIVYLIGDAGKSIEFSKSVFNLLENQVGSDSLKSTVIFLGDNIYPKGMPDKGEKGREEAESIIDGQIDILKNLNIDLYYIPGNHDWDRGGKNGISTVRNEEKYIDDYY